MDYMDVKALSELSESYDLLLNRILCACHVMGKAGNKKFESQIAPLFDDLKRQRAKIGLRYERAYQIYMMQMKEKSHVGNVDQQAA